MGSLIGGVLRRRSFENLPTVTCDVDGEEVEYPDYPEIGKRYAEAVVNKIVPANRLVILACQRYLKMLKAAARKNSTYYFSPDHVIDYCAFMDKLRHVEAGNYEITQRRPDGSVDDSIILEPVQIWVECAIQGFRRKANGTRLVQQVYEEVPRKHAKSLKIAGAGLYDLCCSEARAPQVVIAASTLDQGNRVFNPMRRFASQEPDMIDLYKLKITDQYMKNGVNDGEVIKLSSKAEKQDGFNPSLVILEELHAQAPGVYEVMDSAMGARPNAMLRIITTAGKRADGVAWKIRNDAIAILEGKQHDDSFFAVIFTVDRKDLYDDQGQINYDRLLRDEKIWAKVNPMLNISLDIERVRRAAQKAQRVPQDRGEFLRTRLNVWTSAGQNLVEPQSWARCKAPIKLEDFVGQRCWIGVDLSAYLDMTAIGLIFEVQDKIAVFCQHFLPRESPTIYNPSIEEDIEAWTEAGWLKVNDGAMIDYDAVEDEIVLYTEVFDVQVIAFDPALAQQLGNNLVKRDLPYASFPNRANYMTAPTDDLVARIAGNKLIHNGNPILEWNMINVTGERKTDDTIMPRKESANSVLKIDGFHALAFANGMRIAPKEEKQQNNKPPAKSPYEDRGFRGA